MAKRRKKRRKSTMARGTCKTFTKKNGKKGKVCKMKNGKVKFKPMSFKFSR